MTFIFFPTIVVAALGYFGAKAGDLLRTPLFHRRPRACDESSVVWAYESKPNRRPAASREMRQAPC